MNCERLLLLAQRAAANDGGGVGGMLMMVIYLLVLIAVIAGLWKVFEKAGKPGWGSIIPIYNVILLMEIAGRPIWWVILFFIPCVNLIVAIIASMDVARNFGKSQAFGLGLAFLGFIFYPILGFSDAQYRPVPK